MSDPAFFDSFMQPLPAPVVSGRAFCFAAIGLDHGHIVDMCRGLLSAGAHLKWVYDPDPEKVSAFLKTFPGVIPARNEAQILDDPEIRMVASAAVPVDRCPLGVLVMEAGRAVQFAPPCEILRSPATEFVDRLVSRKQSVYAR